MYACIGKSNIQTNIESIQLRAQLRSTIGSILEKYNIEDTTFGFCGGRIIELSRGFLSQETVYEDVTEATRNMSSSQALRVHMVEGKLVYAIGNVYESLSDCPVDKPIYNIEFLEDVVL